MFREDLYPRIETNPVTVQTYAQDLDVLPPIEVNQNNELIDGWHRWTAHKKNGAKEIRVVITKTASDSNLLELAIMRNAKHGLQLSPKDKMKIARQIYSATDISEQGIKKQELANILSVSRQTINNWVGEIDKANPTASTPFKSALWKTGERSARLKY